MFYFGTALCVLAGLLVIVVAIFKLSTDILLFALLLAVVGFVIQLFGLSTINPFRRFPRQ